MRTENVDKNNIFSIEERNRIVVENDWIPGYILNKLSRKYPSVARMNKFERSEIENHIRTSMIRGVETFDDSKGASISTHLCNWARYAVINYLCENRIVRIPKNVINDQIKNKDKNIVPKEISLDFNHENTEFNSSLLDKLEASISASHDSTIDDFETHDHIKHILENEAGLSEIERFTVIHRFGLFNNTTKTLENIASITASNPKIGKKYTAMGIQKAESRALNKLKSCEMLKDIF